MSLDIDDDRIDDLFAAERQELPGQRCSSLPGQFDFAQ
jgi:hypothetical protein